MRKKNTRNFYEFKRIPKEEEEERLTLFAHHAFALRSISRERGERERATKNRGRIVKKEQEEEQQVKKAKSGLCFVLRVHIKKVGG